METVFPTALQGTLSTQSQKTANLVNPPANPVQQNPTIAPAAFLAHYFPTISITSATTSARQLSLKTKTTTANHAFHHVSIATHKPTAHLVNLPTFSTPIQINASCHA